ncbi:MAG: hypothetical protein OIN66_11680 [Candidatus Methanoperedens sp.]|nr:hypothetical protein [Candidatus Methanoperedens sp.]
MEILKGVVSMSEQEFEKIKAKKEIKGFAEGVLAGMIFLVLLVWYLTTGR